MISWGRISILSIVALSLLTASNLSSAAESGKIYLNGKWEAAKTVEKNSAWNLSGFFGNKEPTSLHQIARDFINENSTILGADSSSRWNIIGEQRGSALDTVRLAKTWKGIPVIGGESLVHSINGRVVLASADNTSLSHITSPTLRPEEAKAIAFASYRGNASATNVPALKIILLGQEKKEARLAYEVTVNDRDGLSSDIHYIDAQRGEELLVTTNIQTIMDRKIVAGLGSDADFSVIDGGDESQWKLMFADKGCKQASAPTSSEGFLSIFTAKKKPPTEGTPTACNTADAKVLASATAAWNNAGLVHNYYLAAHNRDSIDGAGMLMNSVVNFGDAFANAAWVNDKSLMIYGMGDGVELNDFAIALDVAGHEMTHGVTARTAALVYASESGAINESMSDVFGKLVAFKFGKTNDWKLGKELFKDGTSFVRDMENPTIGHTKDQKYKGQPCSRANDFCGVHSNSGIPNKAAVIIAKQLGLEKLGKLYYLTLTQLLTSDINYKDLRAQTEAACSTLYGEKNADCKVVSDAFASVGI